MKEINQEIKDGVEFVGLSGWAAFQAYTGFILYLPLTPYFLNVHESMASEIISEFKDLSSREVQDKIDESKLTPNQISDQFHTFDDDTKLMIFMELLPIAGLSDDETLALLSIHKSKNNIPITAANVGNLRAIDVARKVLTSLLSASKLPDALFF